MYYRFVDLIAARFRLSLCVTLSIIELLLAIVHNIYRGGTLYVSFLSSPSYKYVA